MTEVGPGAYHESSLLGEGGREGFNVSGQFELQKLVLPCHGQDSRYVTTTVLQW